MMDPHSGKLYMTMDEAVDDGVVYPVAISGREEDVLRVSRAVKLQGDVDKRKKRRKKSRSSRKQNR